jgi:phage replication-related protein YjqB (UPF0714/DUF867 family)
MLNMDRFRNFSELTQYAKDGKDFIIEMRKGKSGFAIMAPHGGGIEPGTDFVADAIAGKDHAYYAFKGIRPNNNTPLHIASSRFDEPVAMGLVRQCHTIITIHGCRDAGSVVYVGGKHDVLKQKISHNLRRIRITVCEAMRASIKGRHQHNLCNRGKGAQGAQLEISSILRRRLIEKGGWKKPRLTPQLKAFAKAVRIALRAF